VLEWSRANRDPAGMAQLAMEAADASAAPPSTAAGTAGHGDVVVDEDADMLSASTVLDGAPAATTSSSFPPSSSAAPSLTLDSILLLGQSLHATYSSDPDPRVREELQAVLGLMAYRDPEKEATGRTRELLSKGERENVADELNKAILRESSGAFSPSFHPPPPPFLHRIGSLSPLCRALCAAGKTSADHLLWNRSPPRRRRTSTGSCTRSPLPSSSSLDPPRWRPRQWQRGHDRRQVHVFRQSQGCRCSLLSAGVPSLNRYEFDRICPLYPTFHRGVAPLVGWVNRFLFASEPVESRYCDFNICCSAQALGPRLQTFLNCLLASPTSSSLRAPPSLPYPLTWWPR
jgi:hypothetical protein